MPPAQASDATEMEEAVPAQGVRDLSIRANWRIIAVTLYMGISLFEYGFDKGAIAGFQAMPGFLQVFGYKSASGAWNIEVCVCLAEKWNRDLTSCRPVPSKSSRPS